MIDRLERDVDRLIRLRCGSPRQTPSSSESEISAPLLRLLERLKGIQLRIDAAGPSDELVVRADLGDAAGFDGENHVRPPDGREPVRDHERRPVSHQVGERVLDEQLRFRIERRGRLVENEQRTSFRIARAMASRWRWPPESSCPRSPMRVS